MRLILLGKKKRKSKGGPSSVEGFQMIWVFCLFAYKRAYELEGGLTT